LAADPPPVRPSIADGRIVIVHDGLPRHPFGDFYTYLLRISWAGVIAYLAGAYLAVNAVFAALYYAFGGYGDPNNSPFSAFMFSIETFGTIGYGVLNPQNRAANVLVALEAFVGLISAGMSTGLIFAKFSKPTARVAFAKRAIITNRFGKPTLQVRMANERRSEILSARVEMYVLRDETTPEGQRMRRFHQIKLERDASPLFALSWTVIHPIDEESPFFGVTPETIDKLVGISVNVQGVDDSLAQTIHARQFYRPNEFAFDKQFADMTTTRPDGALHIDHRKLSDLVDPR
jgi:inward rectifier potassium channel